MKNALSIGQRNALRVILTEAQWEAVYAALGQYVDNNDPEEVAVSGEVPAGFGLVVLHEAAQEVLEAMDTDLAALAGLPTEEELAALANAPRWVPPPAPPPAPKRVRVRRQ